MNEEQIVTVPLFERGEFVNHRLPRAIAKEAISSMIKQMDDEDLQWLVEELSVRQLMELAELVENEKRVRAQTPNLRSEDLPLKVYEA